VNLKKTHWTYAEFVAAQKAKNTEGTLAWLIERFCREMNGEDGRQAVRPLGVSHLAALKRIQRYAIAHMAAAEIRKQDIIEFARWRRQTASAATVGQDVMYVGGVMKYAGSAWDDKLWSDAPIAAAKPFLTKNDIIGKSTPRDRRPTDEEIDRLIAYFAKANGHPNTTIDMVKITLWQIRSGRRISETCRLQWGDWDRENHTILVRKMKDPKRRNKMKVVALPEEAQAMLEDMEKDRLDPSDPTERIFPYPSKSCSAAYTRAKRELGIVNLRLHDSRRECATRLIEVRGFSPAEAALVTGHETTQILERTYMRLKPELFKLGPASKRQQGVQHS
jgi:integrase